MVNESAPPSAERKKMPTILDKLTAGIATKDDIAEAIMHEVYAGLKVRCSIPAGYAHCELGEQTLDLEQIDGDALRDLLDNPPGLILNPQQPHREAIEFFKMILEGDPLVCEGGDPLRPTVGAYLQGQPGVGKTHIMAAFGRIIEATLADRLKDIMEKVRSHIDIYHRQYLLDIKNDKRPADFDDSYDLSDTGIKKHVGPDERFQKGMENLKRAVGANKDKPTDMLYLGFEDLCELYLSDDSRHDAVEAIERAPIVFVDDLHGKGDPARLQVIQRLIEKRYELKKFGTFVTTNIDVQHIGGEDENIGKRILSRSRENFVVIDFKDCKDWRETVKHRRIDLIQNEIRRRIAERDAVPPKTPSEETSETEESGG